MEHTWHWLALNLMPDKQARRWKRWREPQLEEQGSPNLYLLRSACLTAQGEVDAASEQLLEAQALFPDDAMVALHLGNLYLASGQFNDAHAQYRRAINDPVYGTQARLGRVICLYQAGGARQR